MINLSNVGKQFGDYWAVKDLNIEVNKGEIFGFWGRMVQARPPLLR